MNDDCKLIERVADALDEAREDLAGFHAKDMARDILPIVRAAQADALREAADHWQDTADHNTPADIDPEWLRTRATDIEKED